MRVLHVYRTYFPDPPGGLQEAIRQIALSCQPLGVESRIYTLSKYPRPPELDRPEAHVVRAKSWLAPASCDIGFLSSFLQFRAAVKSADIIHYHFPWPFADVLHFFVAPDKPCVMTYHSDVVNKGLLARIYRPLMRAMLNSMDKIIATSSAYIASSEVLSVYPASDKLAVIPLGICESSYQSAIEASEDISLQHRYGLKPGQYFLFLGALRAYKGLDYLLEAVAGTNMQLVIAGDGHEGVRLKHKIQANPNILWVGQVSDAEKMALITGCRSLVLPSHLRSEAFGVVLIEAAMMGKPLITCDIGTGTTFVNKSNETGLVVPPRDALALRDAMSQLSSDTGLCAEMGKAAQARYEALFSGAALGASYHDLYRDVLSRHRA